MSKESIKIPKDSDKEWMLFLRKKHKPETNSEKLAKQFKKAFAESPNKFI